MENILLVTASKKSADMLLSLIRTGGWHTERILAAASCSEARRLLIDNTFDLILINTPLSDEFGHDFAMHASEQTLAGVVLLVKAELADSVSERVEREGVFVVTKPISRPLFYQALHLVNASRSRLYALQKENHKLRRRMEDMRVTNRAKCLLIAEMQLSEAEAHAYLERQAMNTRRPLRDIAEDIIRRFT